MPACPAGHDSSATDFCDTCGMRIGGSAATASGSSVTGGPDASGSSVTGGPDASGSAATGGPDASGSSVTGGPDASGSAGSAATGGPASGGSVQAATAPGTETGEACPQCDTDRSGQFCEVCGFDFSSGSPTQFAAASGNGQAAGATSAPETESAPATSAASATSAAPATGQAPVTTPLNSAAAGSPGDPVTSGDPAADGTAAAWSAVATADQAYYDTVIEAGGPDAASIQFPGYCPERRFPLAGKELRIGRRSASRGLEPEIDLTGPPADPGISHLHAVLIAQPDGTWSVLDPGSSNGTQVNGVEITEGAPVPLADGDRISLGAWTVLTVHSEPD